LNFIWVALPHSIVLNPQLLGEIDDERKILNGILIDGTHRVVDEVRGEKKGEEEYLRVMVLVLIKCSYSFRVYHKQFQFLPIVLGLNELIPYPETFSTWVNSGSNSKA
jgi:hypothetical protein